MNKERTKDRSENGSDAAMPFIGIVMGVAGVGKTAVGRQAAEELGWSFVDGDDHHPSANVEKMSRGIPLTDGDRYRWLETLQAIIAERIADRRPTIITCSALKASYRRTLAGDDDPILFIFLKAPPDVVRERIRRRAGHFFEEGLLNSQFDVLEEPNRGVTVDATKSLGDVVADVVRALRVPERE